MWRLGGRVPSTRRPAAPPHSPPASPWPTQSPGRGAGQTLPSRTTGEQGTHCQVLLVIIVGLVIGLIAYCLIFGLIGLVVLKVSKA